MKKFIFKPLTEKEIREAAKEVYKRADEIAKNRGSNKPTQEDLQRVINM